MNAIFEIDCAQSEGCTVTNAWFCRQAFALFWILWFLLVLLYCFCVVFALFFFCFFNWFGRIFIFFSGPYRASSFTATLAVGCACFRKFFRNVGKKIQRRHFLQCSQSAYAKPSLLDAEVCCLLTMKVHSPSLKQIMLLLWRCSIFFH